MLKRSLRNRSLHDNTVTDYDVNNCIEALLRGEPCDDVPAQLANPVITTLTAMRKDFILQRRDAAANKIDIILGELKRGPHKFEPDTPENPQKLRTRTLKIGPTEEQNRLSRTGASLTSGASLRSVDIPTRLAVTPILKTSRVLEVSRMNYPTSKSIDHTLDNCFEYEIDSRRVGPRLLKVQDIQKKLDIAIKAYSEARITALARRQRFEDIRSSAEVDFENKLKDDMLVFGSYVPTTLPLEYSKFSNKVLDTRVREHRSAQIKRYDDAQALRSEALKKERQELDSLSEKFTRSFKLQRQHMLHHQDMQRKSFQILWKRKKEKQLADTNSELERLKRSVEHLQKQLVEAEKLAGVEISRIKNNDRLKALTPLAARQKGMRALNTFA